MLYLRTGANGSCKTLFTLADVRKLQLETNRPVCINGRFKMKPAKLAEFGWRVIDFKDWQDQPDGTIFFMDECHNDMPVRPNSAPVPEAVRMLAEHRARGFDFFFLTQHPMNMDAFVRKLIGAPGWHQHLKRVFGATNATRVLQWDAVRVDCEKDGSGKSAQITTRRQPKEVYDWYDSAELHTGKVRIPQQVYTLVICLVLFVVLIWYAIHRLTPKTEPPPPPPAAGTVAPGGPARPAQDRPQERHVLTPQEYAASFEPRFDGIPQSAPRYDELTKPTRVPYPAACIHMGDRCECYSQQATKLQVPMALCKQIVAGGFFMDWDTAVRQAQNGLQPPQQTGAMPVQQHGTVTLPTTYKTAYAELHNVGRVK